MQDRIRGMSDDCNTGGLIDAALEISARRRHTLGQLKDALERNNVEEAIQFAKQLCGIQNSNAQTCNRTDTSIN